jgi:hypothetical protein
MNSAFNILANVCLAASLILPATGMAAKPPDFKVAMDMFRNGKLMAETTFTFTSRDEQWTMQSETVGLKGLARLIGLEERSFSRGDWQEGVPRPLNFERNVKAIKTMRWTAEFDWSGGEVRSVYPDGESLLGVEPGVVDESTLGMLIRLGLEHGEDEWFLQVLDEDEIEQQHYRSRPAERIETALGCVTVYAVEKIRRAGSTRYTRTYHARDHAFVPVFIEHGKKDGDHLESRLKTLEIDGKTVSAGPDCT